MTEPYIRRNEWSIQGTHIAFLRVPSGENSLVLQRASDEYYIIDLVSRATLSLNITNSPNVITAAANSRQIFIILDDQLEEYDRDSGILIARTELPSPITKIHLVTESQLYLETSTHEVLLYSNRTFSLPALPASTVWMLGSSPFVVAYCVENGVCVRQDTHSVRVPIQFDISDVVRDGDKLLVIGPGHLAVVSMDGQVLQQGTCEYPCCYFRTSKLTGLLGSTMLTLLGEQLETRQLSAPSPAPLVSLGLVNDTYRFAAVESGRTVIFDMNFRASGTPSRALEVEQQKTAQLRQELSQVTERLRRIKSGDVSGCVEGLPQNMRTAELVAIMQARAGISTELIWENEYLVMRVRHSNPLCEISYVHFSGFLSMDVTDNAVTLPLTLPLRGHTPVHVGLRCGQVEFEVETEFPDASGILCMEPLRSLPDGMAQMHSRRMPWPKSLRSCAAPLAIPSELRPVIPMESAPCVRLALPSVPLVASILGPECVVFAPSNALHALDHFRDVLTVFLRSSASTSDLVFNTAETTVVEQVKAAALAVEDALLVESPWHLQRAALALSSAAAQLHG